MLDNYQRAVIERMEKTTRNSVELAKMLKVIDERPGLASYNYTSLMDIHEATFYRNIKILRSLGLVHPTKYKLNPKAELATPTAAKELNVARMVKNLGQASVIHGYVITVAQKGITEEEIKALKELIANNTNVQEQQDMFSLMCLMLVVTGDAELFKDAPKPEKEITIEDVKHELERIYSHED